MPVERRLPRPACPPFAREDRTGLDESFLGIWGPLIHGRGQTLQVNVWLTCTLLVLALYCTLTQVKGNLSNANPSKYLRNLARSSSTGTRGHL